MLGKRLINSNDAAAGGACTTNTNDYPITNVAYYKMSTAADEKDTYNGTASNVNFNVQGKFGNAAEFNESSNGRIVLPKLPTLTSDVSVSGWFKLRNTAVTDRLRAFSLNAVSGYGGTFESLYRPSDGQWVIRVGNGTSSDTNVLTHTYQLTQSTWYHICFTRDDSTNITKFYINGLEQDSETVSATATIQSSAISVIGNQTALVAATTWKGSIDQVRIFSSALDATQVASLYNEVYCVPTIVPTDNFEPVIYSGNNTAKTVSVGFAPDLVWIKNRNNSTNSTHDHSLFDSVRTTGYRVRSNSSGAANDYSSHMSGFTSGGFNLTTSGALNDGGGGGTYVAWNWKAGGAAVSNTDGTITSQVSANVDAGFSIVSYTGTGSAASVGHGLDTPEFVVIKRLDGTSYWQVWYTGAGINPASGINRLYLNDSQGNDNSTTNVYYPDATKINFNSGDHFFNGSSSTYIAYCFHSVDGFSKIGSYTGTGATGNTIVTGFRPAYLMTKRTDVAGYNWYIWDNKTSPTNPRDKALYADTSGAEQDFSAYPHDFNSNGFSVDTTSTAFNANGGTYIFMAFAEEGLPYVTRNATNPFGDSSELALYKFEDNANDAEGSYNGTASNVTYATGYINKAAVFNGSSSRITTNGKPLNNNTSVSLSFWAKNISVSNWSTLMGEGVDSIAAGYRVVVRNTNDGNMALARSNGSGGYIIPDSYMYDFGADGSDWVHLVFTVSPTEMKYYKNGQNVLTQSVTNTSTTASAHNFHMMYDPVYGEYVSGQLDQVRIFNRTLDDGEVTALYNE